MAIIKATIDSSEGDWGGGSCSDSASGTYTGETGVIRKLRPMQVNGRREKNTFQTFTPLLPHESSPNAA